MRAGTALGGALVAADAAKVAAGKLRADRARLLTSDGRRVVVQETQRARPIKAQNPPSSRHSCPASRIRGRPVRFG